MNIKTFEQLWSHCEDYHKSQSQQDDISFVIEEIVMKTNLYKALLKPEKSISDIELKQIKSHILGEILFSITNLSLKDDIDVFNALYQALSRHS